MDNQQGLKANPQYTINYLAQENTRLVQENAMLKAYIQEIQESQQDQQEVGKKHNNA